MTQVQRNQVIFLNRAYNDLDIQMPLIAAFAEDARFDVRVIGYPCDGEVGSPHDHEASLFLKQTCGVSFETLLDTPPAPFFLRGVYKLERAFARLRKNKIYLSPVPAFLCKAPHILLRIILKSLLRKNKKWIFKATEGWNPAILIVDDVFAQPGRSLVIDDVLPLLAQKGVALYAILTGHRIYFDPNPGGAKNPGYKPTAIRKFFVPNALNREIYAGFFPKETIESAGNLRMDKNWIEQLHSKILRPPFYNVQDKTSLLPDSKETKIAIMLSKMNYGVEAGQLKDTIRSLAAMPDIELAIKPHTRGMRFDFMDKNEIGHAVIADHIPSALLIEWADIILFTGSSIVFHAMLLEKTVGFLKYCQNLETIFDDGKACVRFDSREDLVSYIKSYHGPSVPDELESWLESEIHNGQPDGLIAQHYKTEILKDAGLA